MTVEVLFGVLIIIQLGCLPGFQQNPDESLSVYSVSVKRLVPEPSMPDAQIVTWIKEKYNAIQADLDERARRRWAAAEARSLVEAELQKWHWQRAFRTERFVTALRN